MDIMSKLEILTMAAKYDVACTSSGSARGPQAGSLGTAVACGICHSFASDGRCISLLKVLMTNACIYDCQYCVNRRSNDIPRATMSPREIAELTINFYKRNYIEGLFLSSAVIKNPDYTMELLHNAISIIRTEYKFAGYIHVKAIPGADTQIIRATGLLVDRMSCNIELPSSDSLKTFAPEKTKESILKPMKFLQNSIVESKNEIVRYKSAPIFVPGGQSTQLIVGATPETDKKIVTLAENLYKSYQLKRVFYSAYNPVPKSHKLLPTVRPPLLREHRLYQADFLLRFYSFTSDEILENDSNLNLNLDPKAAWAIRHLDKFPVEVMKADYKTLLRIPGIGQTSAKRIIDTRKVNTLDFLQLKKMGIVLKRARYFITCDGKMMEKLNFDHPEIFEMRLTENKISESHEQMNIFEHDEFAHKMISQRE